MAGVDFTKSPTAGITRMITRTTTITTPRERILMVDERVRILRGAIQPIERVLFAS